MIYPTLKFEEKLWREGKKLIAGVDEVGRGAFAGPVVVGAVIFFPDSKIPAGIADSKLLTAKKRQDLESKIKKWALGWAVAEISVEVINRVGIGKATQMAFVNAVSELKPKPEHILIDGFFIQCLDKNIQTAIIDGDKLSISIAAASILAKVYRDQLMERQDASYSGYGFGKHKGYGTKFHREMIKKRGLCP